MGVRIRKSARILGIVLLLGGCAAPPKSTLRGEPPPPPAVTAEPAPRSTPPPAVTPVPAPPQEPAEVFEIGRDVVRIARGYLGAPYRLAGRGPDAFDCSGLVQRSFAAIGVRLPRTSGELARTGRPVAPAEMRPGDLVLFANNGRGRVDHVGIFSGRGRFVHASSSRGVVEDALGDTWFRDRFVGARRVLSD
jgi:cell wall-associated NlpC family hydrolase